MVFAKKVENFPKPLRSIHGQKIRIQNLKNEEAEISRQILDSRYIYSLLNLTCEEALCFSQTSCSPAWLWLHQPAVDGSGAEAFFRMMLVLDLVLRSAKLSSVCAFALQCIAVSRVRRRLLLVPRLAAAARVALGAATAALLLLQLQFSSPISLVFSAVEKGGGNNWKTKAEKFQPLKNYFDGGTLACSAAQWRRWRGGGSSTVVRKQRVKKIDAFKKVFLSFFFFFPSSFSTPLLLATFRDQA